MTDTALHLRYLSEPDMIAAGVTDIARCVDVMEETLMLLRRGDFRMAGPTVMSHGAMIGFPKDPEFAGMPADGPDRRFMAMPAYLGGRFGTTGVKWYGSNHANRERGLPRSIHLFVLNDADTGAPLAVMSANLLSAYRTGAIPGVAIKHCARSDATTLGVIGPGVIGQTVAKTALTLRPTIERIIVNGRSQAGVASFAGAIRAEFPAVSIEAVTSVEAAVRDADIVTCTVTTASGGSANFPYIDQTWIKPGALLVLPAAARFDDNFLLSDHVRLTVDSWRLYDAWAEEYGTDAYQLLGIPGTHWHDLMRAGKLPAARIEEVADIAGGKIPGRNNDEEIILSSAGGMPVEDVAWATDIYRRAEAENIGTVLPLWDQPALA